MERRTVELRIAGQNYRVTSSAAESDLARLAEMVEAKLGELAPRGRSSSPQAMLLAAIALAHDVEAERLQREKVERRTRDVLRRVLMRIDDALEPLDPHDEEPARAAKE
jgi:cell division protein ZapA